MSQERPPNNNTEARRVMTQDELRRAKRQLAPAEEEAGAKKDVEKWRTVMTEQQRENARKGAQRQIDIADGIARVKEMQAKGLEVQSGEGTDDERPVMSPKQVEYIRGRGDTTSESTTDSPKKPDTHGGQ